LEKEPQFKELGSTSSLGVSVYSWGVKAMTFKPEDVRQDKELSTLREKVNQLETDLSVLTTKIDTLTQVGKYILIAVGASLGIDIMPMMGEM
jgi:peptidoglycan hydrolase CwlO-like protein